MYIDVKRQKNHLSISCLTMEKAFEWFELGGWDWAHFLCLFFVLSDLTYFIKIHSLRIVQNVRMYYVSSLRCISGKIWL
jgi:hypothetical protein